MSDGVRYSIGELAAKAGISRRTVRFYVQRGLLPSPLGLGRGEHYDDTHLQAVLRIKALQEGGETLEAIRTRLHGGETPGVAEAPAPWRPGPIVGPLPRPAGPPPGQVWTRQVVLPGVELHMQGSRALSERQLSALARFIHELEETGGDE